MKIICGILGLCIAFVLNLPYGALSFTANMVLLSLSAVGLVFMVRELVRKPAGNHLDRKSVV